MPINNEPTFITVTHLCREVAALMPPASNRLEGLMVRLRNRYPSLSEEVSGAVGHAIERLITTRSTVESPFSYLAASAENELKRLLRVRARVESLEALRENTDWEPVDNQLSPDETAIMQAIYDELIAEVVSWRPGGVQMVTTVYLESAFAGEPLSSSDAALLVGHLLGETVSENSVRAWKSRGFRRLRQYLVRNLLEIKPRTLGGQASHRPRSA